MIATEKIWYEYHQKLASFTRSKVAEDAVDDLLQDVFIKIHARIETLKEKTKLESWLYQITRNTIIDHYRSKQTTDELPDWIEQAQPEELQQSKQPNQRHNKRYTWNLLARLWHTGKSSELCVMEPVN